MAFLAAVFLLLTVFNIARKKLTWINTGLFAIFVLLVLHSVVIVVFYLVGELKASADFYVVNIVSSFLLVVFGYWLALLVDRGLFGTRKLSSLARYDYDKFVKQAFAVGELHSYIVKKGFTHGAFLSFYTSVESPGGTEQALYEAVSKRFSNNDCLLISLASRYPSVFIPVSGNFHQTKELEASVRALFSVAVVDLKNSLGEKAAFKAFFSIYGLHADSAIGLMRTNLNFLLSPNAFSKSRLMSYSAEKELAVEAEAHAVSDFLSASASWDIEYSIQKVGSIGAKSFYAAQLTSVPLMALSSEQCFERIEQKFLGVAERYYAMKVLRDFFNSYSQGSIIVYYPIELFLARGFSIKSFLGKIEGQGFELGRIVFCLNLLPANKPSLSSLRQLAELLRNSKVTLNLAVRSNVQVKASVVDYLLLEENVLAKNTMSAKNPLKVHYH